MKLNLSKLIYFAILILLMLNADELIACKLTVGWEDWPPYQLEQNGEVTGLDIEIIKAIANTTGCKLTFKQIPWKRQLLMLKKGQIDVALAASKTTNRTDFAEFSEIYRYETMALFVSPSKKNISINVITDLEKLVTSGKFKLGITRGFHYGDRFDSLLSNEDFNSKIEEVTSDLLNIKKLVRGRMDGFFSDPIVAASTIRKYKLSHKIVRSNFNANKNAVYFMFSNKSVKPNIKEKINNGLIKIKENGKLRSITQKYLRTAPLNLN